MEVRWPLEAKEKKKKKLKQKILHENQKGLTPLTSYL